MKKTKEIGYELGNVYWHNLDGFQKLWNKTDTETKDKIVNGIGELAVKLVSETALNLPVVIDTVCFKAKHELMIINDKYKYCPDCGTKL